MEREELLDVLEHDMRYVRKYRVKEEGYFQLDSQETWDQIAQQQKFRFLLMIIGFSVAFLLIGSLNPFAETEVVTSAFYGLILALVFSFFLKKKDGKQYEARLKTASEEMNRLKEEYYAKALIPEGSRGIHKAERFHYYLSNSIADSLKECAQIYHQEEQNEMLRDSVAQVAGSVEALGVQIAYDLDQVNKSVGKAEKTLSRDINDFQRY